MTKRVTLAPAFILHVRPFSETSVILEAFSAPYGRVSLLAKGARSQRSRLRGILRPFVPLALSWSGKSELMTLTGAECQSIPIMLTGMGLLSGLYLNELLMRLLPKLDAHPDIFSVYQHTLPTLEHDHERERALRLFEKHLLSALGYGVILHQEATDDATPVLAGQVYTLQPDVGFLRCINPQPSPMVFEGEHLLALHQEVLDTPRALEAAKRLMRRLIARRLEGRSLKTRTLFYVNENVPSSS